MERERRIGAERVRVPDRYALHLAPDDLAGLGGSVIELATDLADAALVFARARGFTLASRPRVELVADASVRAGEIEVATSFGETGSSSPADPSEPTMVFDVPAVRAPAAVLREVRRDGSQREIAIDGTLLTIGRAADNGLVLRDSRVSRHHARLRARHGMLVLTDLGSTNGVLVNGVSVAEVALGVGDRVQIGDTVLVVDAVAPD